MYMPADMLRRFQDRFGFPQAAGRVDADGDFYVLAE
jgi:hypothetical protein